MGLAFFVFLTVCLSILVGHQLVSAYLARDAARLRQRLADEFSQPHGTSAAPATPLYKNLDQLSLDPGSASVLDSDAPRPAPPPPAAMDRVAAWLAAAGLAWKPAYLFAAMAVLTLVAGVAATWFGGKMTGTFAALVAAAAPLVYVHLTWKARHERYLKQLPNAFELMARVIRAGQSVPQSLQAVADAFDDPLASEFKACLQKQNLGMRPEVAFQMLAESSGILEMRIFAMAMLIQRQTGGNLSEVLERLAGLVRTRLKLRQRVRALTAEGRLQGGTLVVLPIVVFVAMFFVNREYAEVLLHQTYLLIGTIVSMAVGVAWIHRIVSIDQ